MAAAQSTAGPIPFDQTLCPFIEKSTTGEHVRLHLVGIGETIHLVKQPDHGQHFSQGLRIESEPLHGGGVRVDSVRATVGHGDRERDDLLGQQVDLSWPHDGLEPSPT
jgi:hypothetical protein